MSIFYFWVKLGPFASVLSLLVQTNKSCTTVKDHKDCLRGRSSSEKKGATINEEDLNQDIKNVCVFVCVYSVPYKTVLINNKGKGNKFTGYQTSPLRSPSSHVTLKYL